MKEKLSRFLTTGFTREILKYNTKEVKFTNIFLILYLEFCIHMSNMFANLTGFLLLLLTPLLILITKAFLWKALNISGITLLSNTQHNDRDVEMWDFKPTNIGLHTTSTSFHFYQINSNLTQLFSSFKL